MTDEERRALANLILTCPSHNRIVDDNTLENGYPAPLLREWKRQAESRSSESRETNIDQALTEESPPDDMHLIESAERFNRLLAVSTPVGLPRKIGKAERKAKLDNWIHEARVGLYPTVSSHDSESRDGSLWLHRRNDEDTRDHMRCEFREDGSIHVEELCNYNLGARGQVSGKVNADEVMRLVYLFLRFAQFGIKTWVNETHLVFRLFDLEKGTTKLGYGNHKWIKPDYDVGHLLWSDSAAEVSWSDTRAIQNWRPTEFVPTIRAVTTELLFDFTAKSALSGRSCRLEPTEAELAEHLKYLTVS